MAENIESLRRPLLEVIDLPTKSLHPDPANPNALTREMERALARDIIDHGFVQPVVVRPEHGGYKITDGEHRWIVLRDSGSETTPCVIDDADEDAGRLRNLTMNQLRGKPDPVKMAKAIVKLQERYGDEELQERLGMPSEEFDETLSFADAGADLDEKLQRLLDREAATAPEVMVWSMGPRQGRTVERVLEELTEDGTSRADALIAILQAGE